MPKIVKILLLANADPNAVTDDRFTALMMAAQEGHTEIVKMLLAARANPNAITNDGKNVLSFAEYGFSQAKTQEERKAYQQIIEMLKAAGAK